MRKVKVAATQMSCSTDSKKNIAKAISFVKKAAGKGANIILLQELFETQYFCQIENYDNFKMAHTFDLNDNFFKQFSDLAKEQKIVLPISFFEKDNNNFYNSLTVFDADGNNLGLYRKTHIPTGECYEEKFYFTPGDTGFKVFDTKFGKIGVAICWDQWFPETSRILALNGAEFLMFPTAIGSEPVLEKDSSIPWRNAMTGQAAANIIPLIASNRIGTEKTKGSSMTFFGNSFICNEDGEVIKSLKKEEGIIIAEFDLDKIQEKRQDWGVYRDRRPDMYSDLIKKK